MAASGRMQASPGPGRRARRPAAGVLLAVASCVAAPAAPQAEGRGASPEPPRRERVFSEDPWAQAAGGRRRGMREDLAAPHAESRMVELEAPPELPAPEKEEILQAASERNLALLRARILADELGRNARVVVPPGPHTFGDVIPVRLEVQNPFGDAVALLPPWEGLALELSWEVRRWLPVGGHDRVLRHRWFRLTRWFELQGGESWTERTELPLVLDGDPGAVWELRVDARLWADGAMQGDRELPVRQIEFQSARIHAFPPGWRELRPAALEEMERAAASPDGAADRHVLVCAALLEGEERYDAVDLLVERLRRAPHQRRAVTICSALQYLTRFDLGHDPGAWLRWAARHDLLAGGGAGEPPAEGGAGAPGDGDGDGDGR